VQVTGWVGTKIAISQNCDPGGSWPQKVQGTGCCRPCQNSGRVADDVIQCPAVGTNSVITSGPTPRARCCPRVPQHEIAARGEVVAVYWPSTIESGTPVGLHTNSNGVSSAAWLLHDVQTGHLLLLVLVKVQTAYPPPPARCSPVERLGRRPNQVGLDPRADTRDTSEAPPCVAGSWIS